MLLLDQGLPRSTTIHLSQAGIEAVHVGDLGLATASDAILLEYARERGQVVVTLDADFHRLLALSGAAQPSVIRIRMEGLRAPELTQLLLLVLERCQEELDQGAVVSVSEAGVRLRKLPLLW